MQRTYQLAEFSGARLDPEVLDLLRQRGRRLRFDQGALVQQRGEAGDGFWLVESGTAAICRFAADGRITLFGVVGAGDLFGELAYFTGAARQVDVVAQSKVTLIQIGARLIEDLIAEQPGFARNLLRSLANQLRAVLDQLDSDRRLGTRQRLCRMLSEMAERDGPELNLTQQGLGEVLGLSRITVGQILAQLKAAGLIRLGYRRITVTDLAGLHAASG